MNGSRTINFQVKGKHLTTVLRTPKIHIYITYYYGIFYIIIPFDSTIASERLLSVEKNEHFLPENTLNLTHEILFDKSNK